ncbi:MAG: DNA repair protein RecN [Deltaproteobacteria bacterium]|nr:DNA repair protein RecN [Deltaproteobacteria bacterium]
MLVQLNITDFAIIKNIEISLRPGLNILSGETGAGKSIVINAMNLILGGRASADLIRSGCREARVEALFSFPQDRLPSEILTDLGRPFDGELLIKRTVSREGRNRISVNGAIVTLQMLSLLGSTLISISGQYEHQLLLKPDNHLYLLDDFGGLSEERTELAGVFNKCQLLKEKKTRLEKEINNTSGKQELTRFQIREIEEAEIIPGEDEALAEEKRRLQHAEELREIVSEGYQTIYERSDSVLSSISQCAKRMDMGAELDPRLCSIRDGLKEIEVTLEDISFGLRDFQNEVHMDPYRLEQVMDRLELLNTLKRKYGPTLDDVHVSRDRLAAMMYDLDEKKERLSQLEAERQELDADVTDRAGDLSGKRKKAAKKLEKAVEKELQHLHMRETRFQVKFDGDRTDGGQDGKEKTGEIRADGFDRPEFLISPNVGEELRPLSKIASGGELSRIMLAIKTILARTASVETIIFDEVDSGISGATAEVVGEKVLSLAEYHQIICITHLPQIASQGKTHFLVKKEVSNGRTHTLISELDDETRVQEIARLVGGKEITSSAVAHAREMLDS